MAVTLAAVTTAIMLAATLASEVDSAIRAHNLDRAQKAQKQLDAVMANYQIKRNQLDRALAQHNLSYDKMMSNLEFVSRAGSAYKYKQREMARDKQIQDEYQKKSNQLDAQQTIATNALQQQVTKYQNRGLYDAIGGIINA